MPFAILSISYAVAILLQHCTLRMSPGADGERARVGMVASKGAIAPYPKNDNPTDGAAFVCMDLLMRRTVRRGPETELYRARSTNTYGQDDGITPFPVDAMA